MTSPLPSEKIDRAPTEESKGQREQWPHLKMAHSVSEPRTAIKANGPEGNDRAV